MSFVILKTFLSRLAKIEKIDLKAEMFNEMIQYQLIRDRYEPNLLEMKGHERPPMESIPEYRKKFNIN